ncbi:TIGR03557 family F420-dependent LLM class oxidoreductase [Methanocella conradii]|uniref:TIGR03557 family F420-dependent LLM class oxidoreductase n=1 Tax=Methanocella conradii TaxID=1175444 RepID=UPI00157E208F|nr:TIGR03557 family F420-dependent LLM class oxidoreductase [Methanocella conradii]
MLKLGWKAGPEQYQPTELLDYVVAAEKAGFETVDVSDHFHPWSEHGHSCFTWAWLGAAAVKTRSIELGPGVTCPILRYHPAIIAQAAATIDNLAPGRTYLAVGTGEALNEYSATGSWPDYPERQAMMAEAIHLIRELWKGGEVTFNGDYYKTRRARLYTPPLSRIPIYVSSLVPESAGFAGMHGDGLITVANGLENAKQIVRNFEKGAHEIGRNPSSMPRLIELSVAYTDDRNSAIDCFKKYWAGAMVPAMFNLNLYTPKMSELNGSVVGMDTILKKTCISTDPDDHVELARKYIDMGFTHLFFHSAGPDQMDFIVKYGSHLLPRIRQMHAQEAVA